MSRKIEHRTFILDELRADDGENPKINGHAAVFNRLSEPIFGMYREKINPGAFSKTIKEADVRALFNHNPDYVLGRMRGRKTDTLELREDSSGLAFEIDPPDTGYARDLMVSIKRGDIDQASFGFITIKDSWERKEDKELDVRTLHEVQLFDVSPVTYPAYTQTDVMARAEDLSQLLEVRGKLARHEELSEEEKEFLIRTTGQLVPGQELHTIINKDNPPKDWQLLHRQRRQELAEKAII